jgi:uncharacterized membrane protein
MKITWYVVALFAILIGLYPVLYYLVDMTQQGVLAGKGDLLESRVYMFMFYMHITGGGIALLTGWSQFRQKFRINRLALHRILGKIYLIAVIFIGGPSGIFIAYHANGGLVSKVGFGLLGIFWWIFSAQAYLKIQQGNVDEHKQWMIRSYALTFAAVTLRILLPLLGMQFDFEEAYPLIAWLCWVPNMMFAEVIIRKNWVLA